MKSRLVFEIDEAEQTGILTAEQGDHTVIVEFTFDPFEHTKMVHFAAIKAYSMLEELHRNPIPDVEFPKQEAKETSSTGSASKSKGERKSKSKSKDKDTSGKARKSSPEKKPEQVEKKQEPEEQLELWQMPFGSVATRPGAK